MVEKRSKPDQYQLRFPPGLRDKLKHAAESRARSLNAEIIARLENSFRGWPKITLTEDLFARVQRSGMEKRSKLEKEIKEFVYKAVDRELPSGPELHQELHDVFNRLLDRVPDEEREAIRGDFWNLSNRISSTTALRDPE